MIASNYGLPGGATMNTENFTITLEKHPTKDVEKQHVNGSLTVFGEIMMIFSKPNQKWLMLVL